VKNDVLFFGYDKTVDWASRDDNLNYIESTIGKKPKAVLSIDMDNCLEMFTCCFKELSNYESISSSYIDSFRGLNGIVQSVELDEPSFVNTTKNLVEPVTKVLIERAPWFVEILKMIPLVGTIVGIVDAILTAIGKRDRKIKGKDFKIY